MGWRESRMPALLLPGNVLPCCPARVEVQGLREAVFNQGRNDHGGFTYHARQVAYDDVDDGQLQEWRFLLGDSSGYRHHPKERLALAA